MSHFVVFSFFGRKIYPSITNLPTLFLWQGCFPLVLLNMILRAGSFWSDRNLSRFGQVLGSCIGMMLLLLPAAR